MLCSCSSTVQLNSVSEAMPKLRNRDAKINLNSGQSLNCRQISLDKEFIFCISQGDGNRLRIPTKDIKSIEVKHGVGGALEGLVIGGTAGAGIGYLAVSGSNGGDRLGRGLAVISGGAIGGLTGLIIGSLQGHNYTLILPQDSTSAIK